MNFFASFFNRRSPEANASDSPPSDPRVEEAKERMLREHLEARGIDDPRVLEAMRSVPREQFMDPETSPHLAYDDGAYAIGCGQTISQPYIVALMSQALQVAPGDRVLEIGTGSGYQTAILACLEADIVSIERHSELAQLARERLERLGLAERVEFHVSDGTEGYAERSPYDRIIVAAAGRSIPEPLWEQLAEGGILVGPFGPERNQTLSAFRKVGQKRVEQVLCPCRFVPLVSDR